MFEQLSDNLNFLMAEVHISADELARRTGVPASTIKKIRNKYNPNPTLTTLLPLAAYFSIKLGQLVGDEPLPDSRLRGLYKVNPDILKHLPVISWQEAIDWPKNKNDLYSTMTSEFDCSENAYALVVEEDDWENLAKGTALLVDPLVNPEHRDFVIVYKAGQHAPLLKQMLFDEADRYLKPVIQGYNIVQLTDEHKILGVVVEYKKHLKKVLSLYDAK